MNLVVYKISFILLVLGLSSSIYAQEFLTGSRIDPQIFKDAKQTNGMFLTGKSESQPLLLPFFEDFSNYTGYPNENLFIDKQTFVNNSFPVFPPTIGVVTLDALNESGEIYPHLNATSNGADTLTSRFIRLDSLFIGNIGQKITAADSVYFSFYFQPGGAGIAGGGTGTQIGNQPNINDSLVLEFGFTALGDTAITWKHIWSTPGFNVNQWTSGNPYQYFKQVMIPITDDYYFCNNFQFRFRNYASLEPQQGIPGWEGNVDQWHIDYIRLDVHRSTNDVFTNDLAFVSPTTSFLKNYQAMPWKQFQNEDMKSNFTNQLTNLSDGVRTSTYEYQITRNGNTVASYVRGAIDIDPYFTNGIQNKAEQASPPISYKPNSLSDTTTFRITHIFQIDAGIDIYAQNDTCVFEQKFLNYFAYDDGTAEYGYVLNNQYNIAFLAMKFSLNRSDSLSAVRMWFNQTKNHENEEATFSIIVWKDNNGEPGEIIFTLEACKPEFGEEFLDFAEYRFNKILLDTGKFWIGFEQQGNVQLNIGFDQNNDSRAFFRYNTQGVWETSAYAGTPMIRPVFGDLKPLKINITQRLTTTIAPNPATDYIQISNQEIPITKVEIFNIIGQIIDTKQCRDNYIQMNMTNHPPGIYFVRVTTANHTVETFKLIKN